MKTPGGLDKNNPASPLLLAHISFGPDVTTAAGNAGGTTLVCAGLANEPSYDGLVVKILSGGAAGQARTIEVHGAASNTLRWAVPFTDSTGAAQQIGAGTLFVILTSIAGGGGPGPAPTEGISYYGIVDAVPGANQFTISSLAGLGAGKFAGATNPYQAFVLRDAGGASAAPQGELQAITAYTTATGVFATAAFTAAVAVGDEILIVNPGLAGVIVILADLAVPAADSAANVLERDVIGNKTDTIAGNSLVSKHIVPAADSANNAIMRDVIGNKTDTNVGDSLLARNLVPTANVATNVNARDVVGNKADAATLDDLSALATASLVAEVKRALIRMSSNAFTATIQGAARTELDTMLEQIATYFVAAGAAMSLQVNGNAARTNLQQALSDLTAVFGADGANVFNPTIQGAARTDLDTALAQLATYSVAAGAAMALQVNNNAARTNLQQALSDYFAVVGCDGANIFSTTIQGAARTTIETAFDGLAAYLKAAGAAFSSTIQGAARTDVESAFTGLAAYFVAAGAALSVTIDPGGAARTSLATLWNDLGQMLAGAAGITTWPASAPPGNGVSIAEAIRQIYDQTDTLEASVARHLFSLEFWSASQEEVQLAAAATTLSLPNIIVGDLPAGATVVRAIVMLKARMIENTNAGANKLNGATVAATSQVIQIRISTPGAWADCINFVDDQYGVGATTREGGDLVIGDTDVATTVTANATYNLQWLLSRADLNNLNFNDVQVGLKIWYSV